MNRPLVLDRISLHIPDLAFIELAAEAGFAAISLWTGSDLPELRISAFHKGTPAIAEISAALRQNGLTVAGCEFLPFTDADPVRLDWMAIEAAAELGAHFITAVCYAPMDEPTAARRLAQRADIAAGFGMDLTIEFMAPTLGSGICSVAAADRIVTLAQRPNIGITADMLHLTRCGVTPAEIASVQPERFRYIQLCDGPLHMPPERQVEEAGARRQLPGAGAFRIGEYLQVLPRDLPVGMECPDVDIALEILAGRAFAAGQACLSALG